MWKCNSFNKQDLGRSLTEERRGFSYLGDRTAIVPVNGVQSTRLAKLNFKSEYYKLLCGKKERQGLFVSQIVISQLIIAS